MKLAIMQPYFFPYIGYFQLISAVDKFVFYDDVNYIKNGWVNRNRLFLVGATRYITVPLNSASAFKKINETFIKVESDWHKKILSSIDQSYKKAAFYKPVRELIESVFLRSGDNLAELAKLSVTACSKYIGLDADFVSSSTIYSNHEKTSSDRVIDICRIEKADEYWNLPGGRSLYDANDFKNNGIDLRFLDVTIHPYRQFTDDFIPGLSIIDVLMHNESGKVSRMLKSAESLPCAGGIS